MITPRTFFEAELVIMCPKIITKIIKNAMFKSLRNNRADCNTPEIVSSYSFSSNILQFG